MAAELAPCALCLSVGSSDEMLEVQLPPQQGEPGSRRHLCQACTSAIEAAISSSPKFSGEKVLGVMTDDVNPPKALVETADGVKLIPESELKKNKKRSHGEATHETSE